MPAIWLHCIRAVPALGLPKIISSVGRRSCPTSAALAAWSIRLKTVRPRSSSTSSSRSAVSSTLKSLVTSLRPWELNGSAHADNELMVLKQPAKIIEDRKKRRITPLSNVKSNVSYFRQVQRVSALQGRNPEPHRQPGRRILSPGEILNRLHLSCGYPLAEVPQGYLAEPPQWESAWENEFSVSSGEIA